MSALTDDLGSVEAELHTLADRYEAKVAREVKRAIVRVRKAVSFDDVAAASPAAIPDLWDWDRMLHLTVEKTEDNEPDFDTLFLAMMVAAAIMEGGKIDVTDPFVASRITRDIGNMVVGIRRSSKTAIQRTVQRLLAGQLSQAEAIQIVRSTVGLTPASSSAVVSYRDALVALSEGRGTAAGVLRRWKLSPNELTTSLTNSRIDSLVHKYSDRLLDQRALTIARTETIRAVNAGRLELWRQQQQDGTLSLSAKKVWRTALDERVCPVCAPLDGVVVALADHFSGEKTAAIHPPIHTACRCWIQLEV